MPSTVAPPATETVPPIGWHPGAIARILPPAGGLQPLAARESRRMLEASGPNADQIQYWNEVSGPKWVAVDELIDRQIAPLGDFALLRAAPRPGEHALDVGCGCGRTTLALAQACAPEGAALGLDISGPMLESGRERARELGVSNVRFLHADAQTHAFDGPGFDLVFSRFGVMFFADPVAAFRNLCGAMQVGGRLAFLCWQAFDRNPWMAIPAAAAARHLRLEPTSDPHAPGPFAFADSERLGRILGEAGFESIDCESVERHLSVGGGMDFDDTIRFLSQFGPTGAAMREAEAEVQERALSAMREAVEPFVSDTGIEMPAAAWLVTARNSG